jgi:hypothetical protein
MPSATNWVAPVLSLCTAALVRGTREARLIQGAILWGIVEFTLPISR